MNEVLVPCIPDSVLAKIKELAPAHGYADDWQLMARDLLWMATEPDSFQMELAHREVKKNDGGQH